MGNNVCNPISQSFDDDSFVSNNSRKQSKQSANLNRSKTTIEKPITFTKYKDIEEEKNIFHKLENKEEKINLLFNLDFKDYMYSLKNFDLKTLDIPDDYTKANFEYSVNDEFYSQIFTCDYLQIFLQNKILKHKKIYEKAFSSDKRFDRTQIFKDFLYNLHKGTQLKINQVESEKKSENFDQSNNEKELLKRNSMICYGLLFCGGDNNNKVKIFFNLFRNKENKLKMSENLSEFLLILFIIASYGMCHSRNFLTKYPKIGGFDKELFKNVLKYCQLQNSKKLVGVTNNLLFGKLNKDELSYDEFKELCKLKDKKQSVGYLFNSKGIRFMQKMINDTVIDDKNKSKRKSG